jgi:FkbH-like protein
MGENIRLVVWDLDDTFWKGTVTEGGIKEYVQAHHDIVIELARRGILSSICSKNDKDTILRILQEKGISDYFVFPSISWDPKGMRLAQLVETVQLRAPTIMFIDDNPSNRAEALAMVPSLQVEDETFIAKMLTDPRFKGKDDSELSRLKQYKLLEDRKRDEKQAASSNEEFLRACNVRVLIDYDIEPKLDRAIELINRTNQLNYTKRRLSEDIEVARRQLREELDHFDRQAGLVRVVDKYGDYGYVGFFTSQILRRTIVEGTSNRHLLHFCFSCRTLGMLIEHWVYDHLGRPELNIVGDVLTDLSVPRKIDWVQQVDSIDAAAHPHLAKIAPQIVLYGGCEAHAVGVYLNDYTYKLEVFGNYAANALFLRINSAATALDMCDRTKEQFAAEAEILGLPLHLEAIDYFTEAAPGSLFVFNLGVDAHRSARVRHKVHGWTLVIEPRLLPGANFLQLSENELLSHLDGNTDYYSHGNREHVLSVSRHIREHYELVHQPSEADLVQGVHDLIARIPVGSRYIIVVDHNEARPSWNKETIIKLPWISSYTDLMHELAAEYAYVGVVSFSDVLRGPDDMAGANHYKREVYLRLAQRIIEVAGTLQPRQDAPPPKHRLTVLAAANLAKRRKDAEALELVLAAYQCLLRREPDPGAQGHIRDLQSGRISPAQFLRNITRSKEFEGKWQVSTLNLNREAAPR